MKKLILIFIGVVTTNAIAQDRSITTGVPFLQIAADARAAGMGDIGVATSPDTYSQQWNPAKYAFEELRSPHDLRGEFQFSMFFFREKKKARG